MHYIRLLRPPKVTRKRQPQLELLVTITTDLGDSFLYPEAPVKLVVTAYTKSPSGTKPWILPNKENLLWTPGMRVAKLALPLPAPLDKAISSGASADVCVSATQELTADGVENILSASLESAEDEGGQIMPAWVTLGGPDADVDVLTRRLVLGSANDASSMELEEEIGESIARHIWDAGVLAMCAIAGAYLQPQAESSQQDCIKALKEILSSKKSVNILELGCGVGILGLGLASLITQMRADGLEKCTILMTDLEEAEGRARSNMERIAKNIPPVARDSVDMIYENLDWEDGRKGVFPASVGGQAWDLIMLSDCTYNVDMLPALTETLSAIHTSNAAQRDKGTAPTRVFLATKPRHSSEQALFDLMSGQKWEQIEKQVLPLPVLGCEAQTVELYMFEKK
ncbi:hypothetical protein K4F52_007006 [Lecanicillium sp. MT-2017a]|nr:hypothetical protein K4F52_007006 [Lecanicillium sp. MT-2017a]